MSGTPERRNGRWPAAVLFDLDGTLADSFAAIAAALDFVLVGRGFPGRGESWARRHVGRGAAALVHDAVGEAAGRDLERAIEREFFERYRDTFVPATPPMQDALPVVRWAHSLTGGRVGVVSNKAASLSRRWIEHHGFAPWIALVSGPDTSGVRKPGRGAIEPALGELGCSGAGALLVGDMTVDVETGKAVDMPVVAVHGQTSTCAELVEAGAAAVLDNLGELPGWVESERRRRDDRRSRSAENG